MTSHNFRPGTPEHPPSSIVLLSDSIERQIPVIFSLFESFAPISAEGLLVYGKEVVMLRAQVLATKLN
jgi:hypothetical protein